MSVWVRIMCSVVFIVLYCCVGSQPEVLIEESSAVESLHAPTGGTVELPCDITPALADDRMGLVIWYKQGHDTPIYSFDIREGVMSHWSDPSTLGARATFHDDTNPAILVLTKLRSEDSGQYRCRVDFIKSPTKNTRLNLTILIPPERLIILNQEGDEVQNGILGPYDEGTRVNLTCTAVGGRPTARVSWWKSHVLLANSEARATVSFTLQRPDYGSQVTCQHDMPWYIEIPVQRPIKYFSQNCYFTIPCQLIVNEPQSHHLLRSVWAVTDPSIPPLSEVISIDLNLPVLWLRLQGGKRPLVAGQPTELVCQAVGARPKPNISWWKGGTRLKGARETVSTDGNVTNSILTFMPSIDDAGHIMSCRAVQLTLPHSTQEDGWKMDIQHIPVVTLELGANLVAGNVVEGSDVYLDCRVKANPTHNLVYFTHNGVIVKPVAGVLLANQSLVLQRVSRQAAGDYVCVARNSLGEGSSTKLHLDVKYPPTCKNSQLSVLRAAKGEIVDIDCDLNANPKDPILYEWWFNSSSHGKLELPSTGLSTTLNKKLRNHVYMANSSLDYGWLQCSASNSVGRQRKPCVFQILPADKPSPVKGCDIINVSYDSLTLNCTPGHDGGIQQLFLLQITDASTGILLRNISNEAPSFQVNGLQSSNSLSVSVTAYNKKGESEPVTIAASLLKYPQKQYDAAAQESLWAVLVAVAASVAVLAALAAVVAALCCCGRCSTESDKNDLDHKQQDETSNMPLTGKNETKSVDSLDKNPDIIPLDSKTSDSCSTKSSTTDYSSIRPLISNRYQHDIPPNCRRYYEHNIECNQYIHVRPIEYTDRPTYQPMPNLRSSIQNIKPIPSVGFPNVGNDYHTQPDKVYKDWLKYKNALPLNNSELLPPEQLMLTELYPPPTLYSNPRPLHLSHMPELEHIFHLEGPLDTSFSSSHPLKFQDDSIYSNKSMLDKTSTLPGSQ